MLSLWNEHDELKRSGLNETKSYEISLGYMFNGLPQECIHTGCSEEQMRWVLKDARKRKYPQIRVVEIAKRIIDVDSL